MSTNQFDPNTTAPWARALSFPAVLRDGTRVRVRPIAPTDKTRMAQAIDAMSPQTRYQRFHSLRGGLTDGELRYLTELDYEHHVAWGALAEDEPGKPGIGAARFVRDPEVPDTAEFTVTVVDAWQGRGLGSLLLRTLLRRLDVGGELLLEIVEREVRRRGATLLRLGLLRLSLLGLGLRRRGRHDGLQPARQLGHAGGRRQQAEIVTPGLEPVADLPKNPVRLA